MRDAAITHTETLQRTLSLNPVSERNTLEKSLRATTTWHKSTNECIEACRANNEIIVCDDKYEIAISYCFISGFCYRADK